MGSTPNVLRELLKHLDKEKDVLFRPSAVGAGPAPAAPAAKVVEAKAAAPAPRAPKGRTVLVVGDKEASRKILAANVREIGCTILEADAAPRALETALAAKPDLILLDVMMSGMSGWGCLQGLKADPRTASIPVFLMPVSPLMGKGVLMGVMDFVDKSADDDAFLEIAHRYLPAGGGRILVVDDDEDMRVLLRNRLEREGYEISEAPDGKEALRIAEGFRPNLILLDLAMPVMDGFRFLEVYRSDERNAGVPVAVVTGKRVTHDEETLLARAANSLVRKIGAVDETITGLAGELIRRDGAPR